MPHAFPLRGRCHGCAVTDEVAPHVSSFARTNWFYTVGASIARPRVKSRRAAEIDQQIKNFASYLPLTREVAERQLSRRERYDAVITLGVSLPQSAALTAPSSEGAIGLAIYEKRKQSNDCFRCFYILSIKARTAICCSSLYLRFSLIIL